MAFLSARSRHTYATRRGPRVNTSGNFAANGRRCFVAHQAEELEQIPADTWDSIVESARQRISSQPSKPEQSGLAKLGLWRELAPQRQFLRQYRDPAMIDRRTREAIRCCVNAESPWPLLLHGPAGVGKTCAGLVLCDYARGCYWTMPGLCEHVIDLQRGRVQTDHGPVYQKSFWNGFSASTLIVLDEIGCRERASDHHYETLKTALDARHNRPLLCISNLNPSALVRIYDDRILSRLACGTVVELSGKDRRIEA